MLDCLIIGGGPAGLAAATYLARYRRDALVVDAGESRAAQIPVSHNYAGFKGIGGRDLLVRLREQALLYGAQLRDGRITALKRSSAFFEATLDQQQITARFVLLATGLVDESPTIEGGRTSPAIRYCPICDGYEAMDRKVGVIGKIQVAGKKALFLRTYTPNVAVFETGIHEPSEMRETLSKAGIEVCGGVEGLKLVEDKILISAKGGYRQVDFLYPALGCAVRSEFALALGARGDEVGCLAVDIHQQTAVHRLYAAGDVVTDLHQLSVAIGHAAIAATDIHNRLPSNPR
jgi:thioredoxin reductase (NADPH)